MRKLSSAYKQVMGRLSDFLESISLPPQIKITLIKTAMLFVIAGGAILTIVILAGFVNEYCSKFFPPKLEELVGVIGFVGIANEVRHKTLWDLLQVLAIPAIIAVGAAFFEQSYKQLEKLFQDERLSESRVREYMKSLQDLTLGYDLSNSNSSKRARAIVQVNTRHTIKILDGPWLGSIIDLLDTYGLDLVTRNNPILDLSGLRFNKADLNNRKLVNMNLTNVNMPDSDWSHADCKDISLDFADLSHAKMEKAEFNDCSFISADLSSAELRGAKFFECNMDKVIFHNADLRKATFPGTYLGSVLIDHKTKIDRKIANILYIFKNKDDCLDMEGEDLSDVVLTGVKLTNATLNKVKFEKSRLSFSNLSGSSLKDAKLFKADLTGVDLRSADLTGADLRLTRLEDVKLQNTTIDEKWRVVARLTTEEHWNSNEDTENLEETEKDLSGFDLRDANLQYANMQEFDLREAIFIGANLSFANMAKAKLQRSKMSTVKDIVDKQTMVSKEGRTSPLAVALKTRLLKSIRQKIPFLWLKYVRAGLNKVVLTEKDLLVEMPQQTDLSYTVLTGANLEEADLRRVVLVKAQLDKACLERAKLAECDLDKANLVAANIRWADLSEASLTEADLRESDLTGAILNRADLQGAKLDNGIFQNAKLQGTDFTGASLNGTDLSDADLRDAIITDEQLKVAKSIKGIIINNN